MQLFVENAVRHGIFFRGKTGGKITIQSDKDKDGNIKALTPRQVADLLGHTTSEITELYYVKRDMKMLNGITDGFEL